MAGLIRDCPLCGAAVEVPIAVPPPSPPPLPKLKRPAKTENRALTYTVVGSAIFIVGFIVGRFSTDSLSGANPSTPMPEFRGEPYGNPTKEEFRRGADWLLEQDRLREQRRR